MQSTQQSLPRGSRSATKRRETQRYATEPAERVTALAGKRGEATGDNVLNGPSMTQLERYQLAGKLDTQGDEEGAIVHYDAVYAAGVDGLPPDLIPRFFVGYSSTLRNVGRNVESLAVVRAGLQRFPQSSALRAFEALTLVALGRGSHAVASLLAAMLDPETDRSIETFARSLRAYISDLDSERSGG